MEHVARMDEKRNLYIWIGRPQGKRQLERLKHKYKENIKIHIREIGLQDVNWN